jgi:asparagine synthase (glutamine-hydrolysing)
MLKESFAMSAQAGAWNFDSRPVDQALLGKLGLAIEPYGPDGGNTHVDGSIGMVYRAFHTTQESRLERQPHRSAIGNVITWDGRLDNSDDLIPRLRNNLTADLTDVAIVAAAFEYWGTDCFRQLVGDWAVSIWKPECRELFFAVDYMAIRHIFYYLKQRHVWWSTDLAPLVLLSGDRFHINEDYIAGYFGHDPDAYLTPYREIHQVPPGHFARICNEGNVTIQRYWSFSLKSRIRYKTDSEYEDHFRHVFRKAVRRRLRADAPVLGELSGGVDSSSIICMADDILAKEGAQTPRLDTISFYDKTEPHGDDWLYFPMVEEQRGRVGAHIDASTLGSSPTSFEYLEFVPLPGYVAAGNKLVKERAAVVRSGGYRAVLSGIGGDEFNGAIPNPSAQLADLIVQCKLLKLSKQLIAWSLVKRRPWLHLLWQAFLDLLPGLLGQYSSKQVIEPWIGSHFNKRIKIAIRQIDADEHFGLWLPTRRSYIRGVLLMANKLAKARPSVDALEETRYPYLDQDLIEFLLAIPASQLLRPGERRSLMRRSLADLVPLQILSRRTKQFGARTPVVAVEKNWEELRTAFESPISSQLGYIDHRRFLEGLLAAKSGQEIHIVRMLRTISLEFWLRNLADRGLLMQNTVPSALRAAEELCVKA